MKVRPDTPNRLEKIMAVQKSRRTPATRGARRAHDKLKNPALSVDPTSGETHLRHRVTPDGFYRGNQVVSQPESIEDKE
jgi:large subunit ribosomal protein L32